MVLAANRFDELNKVFDWYIPSMIAFFLILGLAATGYVNYQQKLVADPSNECKIESKDGDWVNYRCKDEKKIRLLLE